jgi:hypothetical protein
VLAAEEHAAQVRRHQPVPVFDRGLRDFADEQVADVIDEDVDPAEGLACRACEPLGRLLLGDVTDDGPLVGPQ